MVTAAEARAELARRELARREAMRGDQPATLDQQEPTEQQAAHPTVQQQIQGDFGFDPNIVDRASILPLGQTKDGETVFAVPQMLMEGIQAILTPGAVAKGAEFDVEDAINTALGAAVPATGSVSGVTRLAKVANKLPKKMVKTAPSTAKLLKKGSAMIENYKSSGKNVSGDDFATFWIKADDMLKREGFDPENTPSIAKRMNSLARRADADEITAQEMINIRRGIKSTLQDLQTTPEDKRLATKLLDEFDDFAMKLPDTGKWREGRSIYAKGKKSQQIEDALVAAGDAASGLENGIRIEFRKILRSEKKRQGFTKEEIRAMRDIASGDFTANTLKRIAGLGFGRDSQMNRLGGSVAAAMGGGAGAAAGGPVGAIVGATAPGVAGAAAGRALEKRTVNAVKALRALVAGAKIPENVIFKDTMLTPRMLGSLGVMSQGEDNE